MIKLYSKINCGLAPYWAVFYFHLKSSELSNLLNFLDRTQCTKLIVREYHRARIEEISSYQSVKIFWCVP